MVPEYMDFEVKTEGFKVNAVKFEKPKVKNEEFEDKDKKFPQNYYEIYKCYKEKDYENCLSFLSEVTEELVEYQILKSTCYINLGKNFSEAHDILNAILDKDSANAYTIYAKGLAFFHEERYKESVECFEKARYLDPSKDMERAEIMIEKAEDKINEKQRIMKHCVPLLNFKRSSSSSHIVRRFGCEICNHFFGKKFNLDRHNRSIHRRSTPLDFPTKQSHQEESPSLNVSPKVDPAGNNDEEPSKRSPVKIKLLAAIQQNGSKKGKAKCPVCHHFFKKSSIARHLIIHSGNKSHKCSECSMAFFQKSDLCRHMVSYKNLD